MDIQLPLPGYWPRNATCSDPREDLAQLRRDKLEAKHEIRLVLDKYASRHLCGDYVTAGQRASPDLMPRR